ncbi:MAG: thioredoxin family protein [Alphaproteobacteria bacterium]|nr:thioredoxin family protein [Alphaproteobacteria bacterium]
MKHIVRFVCLLFLLGLAFLKTAVAQPLSFENDKLKLTVNVKTDAENMLILPVFEMKNDWHISWKNPGDAGVAPKFYLANRQIFSLAQSTPERFLYEDLIVQYAYLDKAYFLFETKKQNKPITFKVFWTACREDCVPEQASFELLPKTTFSFEKKYARALKTFPQKAKLPIETKISGNDLILKIREPFELPVYFAASEEGLFAADSPQNAEYKDGALVLTIKTDGLSKAPSSGVLFSKNKAYDVLTGTGEKSVLGLLLLAFLGGIILNLMPCVFPVLSLKAIAMVQSTYQKSGHIKRAFAYLFGVLACFFVIASALFALKSAGKAVGWGFQLQSPLFVLVMIVLFVFILLYLFDIFKIKTPFVGKLYKASLLNSFLTGFFAVLIASPCTGPFMGAALGYALLEESFVYFPVFLSLGLGYALPFTLLEIFPKTFKKLLPAPGHWMVKLKYILSIPIFLTVLWLCWVLFHQIQNPFQTDAFEPYSFKKVEKALEKGEPVFIDFTAKWCLTCLFNERTVLYSDAFLDKAKQKGVRLFKADWTRYDAQILKNLKTYGRSSVPLYVFYQKSSDDHIVLPQILTLDATLSVLDGQNQNND